MQVPNLCERFAQSNRAVLARNDHLRSCFVKHLLLLWDYALLDAEAVDQCMLIVQKAAEPQPRPPGSAAHQ